MDPDDTNITVRPPGGAGTADRARLVGDVVAILEGRFPLATLAHVTGVVQDAHDAVVGNGVHLRAFLGNLIEHRARGQLRLHEARTPLV